MEIYFIEELTGQLRPNGSRYHIKETNCRDLLFSTFSLLGPTLRAPWPGEVGPQEFSELKSWKLLEI